MGEFLTKWLNAFMDGIGELKLEQLASLFNGTSQACCAYTGVKHMFEDTYKRAKDISEFFKLLDE